MSFALAAILAATCAAAAGDPRSGQDPAAVFLGPGAKVSIPKAELHEGGPAIDGIPALEAPKKVPRAKATFLGPEDRVLGFVHGGEAVAYPMRILNWHEVANDTVGGLEIAATFCPLTGSPIVFQRRYRTRTLRFGVSGLLYNSNLVMFDRETGSLWPQLLGKAISGESIGKRLDILPSVYTSWAEWAKVHPETTVVSLETGSQRDYGRDPYRGYADTPRLYFPVSRRDWRLPVKELVVGLEVEGRQAAVRLSSLRRATRMHLKVGHRRLVLEYSDGPHAYLSDGREVPVTIAYWFAWAAFHPGTSIP